MSVIGATVADTMPIIEGVNSKNELHYPGWNQQASNLFISHLKASNTPITVEDVRDAHREFDEVTYRISGWGAVPLRLMRMGLIQKAGLRLRDDDGDLLRHALGLWWHADRDFDQAFVRTIGIVGSTSAKADSVIASLAALEPAEREIVFQALCTMTL